MLAQTRRLPFSLRSLRFSSAMASHPIYLLPVDPAAVASAANVDAPTLWSSVPPSASGKPAKVGTSHVFFSTPAPGDLSVLSSLGPDFTNAQKLKENTKREVVRNAVGSAVGEIKALGDGVHGRTVHVDAQTDPHAAGMHLPSLR